MLLTGRLNLNLVSRSAHHHEVMAIIERKPMKLSKITDEHIKLLAQKHYDISSEAITNVMRGDTGCVLNWKCNGETGRLVVRNECVYFVYSEGKGIYNADFETIKTLLSLGYEIF